MICLSSDPEMTWGAQVLLSTIITNTLVPGTDYWRTNSVTIPGSYKGRYFFILVANADSDVFETDTADNLLSLPVDLDLSTSPATPIIGACSLLPNGTVQLAVYGRIGAQYTLQASSDLLSWAAITNFVMVAAPTYVVDQQSVAFQQRFYRLAMITAPLLSIARPGTNNVLLSWPVSADGWVLEQTSSLADAPQSWIQVPTPYSTNGAQTWVTITNSGNISFYRLRLP